MISRRLFLQRCAATAGALSLWSAPRPVGATSAAPSTRPLLVVVLQRGAMDGIMAVPPLAHERALAELRPHLTMGRTDGVIELSDSYGLHPALSPLADLYREGSLAVVHGIGHAAPTRSHFDAQAWLESGTVDEALADGWMARALQTSTGDAVRGVAWAGAMPLTLQGADAVVAASDLREFRIGGARLHDRPRVQRALDERTRELWARTTHPALVAGASEATGALDRLATIPPDAFSLRTGYEGDPIGRAFSQLATLIERQVGLEVAVIESGGWDTHVDQGTTRGAFANAAAPLARAIATFWADLGERRRDVLLVTLTEFGRTVTQNGSGGTDHGRGSVSFVLGEQVRGGEVFGTTGALTADVLDEGTDVPAVIEHRELIHAALTGHLGIADVSAALPGWSGSALGVLCS